MPPSLKCTLCEEAATVHLSQVVHGKVTKVHLCEECARRGGATDPAIFQLADALAVAAPPPSLTCPRCGFSDTDFRKRGRLGCPSCWDTFGDVLGGLLRKVQHEPAHHGRAPAGGTPVGRLRRRLAAARDALAKAVAGEDYEVAARLRDAILELERQLPVV